MKTFVLNALPEDFEAALEFDVVVDDPEKIKQLSWEKTLASAPIPGAGVLVKDIFELGLIAKLVAGYTTKLKDGFEFKIGAKTKIPGPTRITIDGVDHPNIGAYGFEGASVEPIFELVSMSKTVDFSLAVKPTLVFGVDIIGADGLDLTLILNLPELKTTFAPTFSKPSITIKIQTQF